MSAAKEAQGHSAHTRTYTHTDIRTEAQSLNTKHHTIRVYGSICIAFVIPFTVCVFTIFFEVDVFLSTQTLETGLYH